MPVDGCHGQNLYCCETLGPVSSEPVKTIFDSINVVIDTAETALDPLVGIHCTPIDVLGITQGQCTNQAVC